MTSQPGDDENGEGLPRESLLTFSVWNGTDGYMSFPAAFLAGFRDRGPVARWGTSNPRLL